MAATFAVSRIAVPGARRHNDCTITGDSSYPTGGYAVTAATCGLSSTLSGIIAFGAQGATARYPLYNSTSGKIMFIVAATGAEVANATDVSANTLSFQAVGV